MRINLTTPMSDDKERQRDSAAIIAAIEQYTEERMNEAYGRIHIDGSRSGGQPVTNDKDSAVLADDDETCTDCRGTGFNAVMERRCDCQPTQSDALRDLVATLWCASGCSCCRDDDAWEKASHELAELFGIPKYDDGSGYDWYSVRDAALQEQSE